MGQCEDARVEPPGAVVEGKSVGEWTATMWQWLAEIPEDGSHPFFDLAGEHCARDQDEAVFLLAPSLFVLVIDDQPFPRDQCVVPEGKPILLPLTWALMWAPGDCDPDRMEDCAGLAASFVEFVTDIEVTIDGTAVPCPMEHRELSPTFEFSLPEPPALNVFDLQEPLTRKAVSDGHWLMLKPLSPGRHTILVNLIDAEEATPTLYEITVAPRESAAFRRGDADGDQRVNLTDAVATLSHLFQGGQPLPCEDAADSNDNGALNLSDAVYTLNHLFRGGEPPPAPGLDGCGTDPTEADELACARGC